MIKIISHVISTLFLFVILFLSFVFPRSHVKISVAQLLSRDYAAKRGDSVRKRECYFAILIIGESSPDSRD